MVDITLHGESITFEVEAMDKLWALKSRLEIPVAHVKSARIDDDAAGRRARSGRRGETAV